MARYVDGFAFPVPRDRLHEYQRIAAVAREGGAEVPFLRSATNADDFAPLAAAVIEVVERLDAQGDAVRPSLEQTYGDADAEVWQQRWRMFFMACEEMFAYDGGQQWQVAHYRFRKP